MMTSSPKIHGGSAFSVTPQANAPAQRNVTAVLLSTACWHTPSETYGKALRAMGLNVYEVVEGTPRYNGLKFPGPGFLYVPGQGMLAASALRDLPALRPSRDQLSLADVSTLAATAVIDDDAMCMGNVWERLNGGQRTLMLCLAATLGADHVARFCLEQQFSVNDVDPMPAGNSALHYAAMSDKSSTVDMLLHFGADPMLLNPVNTRPMHDAARSGAVKTIEAFYARGVDLTQENAYGDTMLHRLAEHVTPEKQDAFIKIFDVCLQDAERRHGHDAVKRFLNQCNRDGEGNTAFDMAVARKDEVPRFAKALTAMGARHSEMWEGMPEEKRTRQGLAHFEEWQEKKAELG